MKEAFLWEVGILALTKDEFKLKMRKARNAFIRAQNKEDEIYRLIDSEYNNLDLSRIPSKAENADNLYEAISCYLSYGEYNIDLLWEELQFGLNKSNETEVL